MIFVRPGQKSDLPALLRLERGAFESDRLERRHLAHAIASPSSILLVGQADCAPAAHAELAGYGLVATRKNSLKARLTSLATAASRPKGAGLALMEALKQAAREKGCATLLLEVRADNDRAIGLYRHWGFHEIGHYDDYYEDGQRALRFAIAL